MPLAACSEGSRDLWGYLAELPEIVLLFAMQVAYTVAVFYSSPMLNALQDLLVLLLDCKRVIHQLPLQEE